MRNSTSFDETKRLLEEYISNTWKSPELLHSLMLGQKKLQTKRLDLLSKASIEKVIPFKISPKLSLSS